MILFIPFAAFIAGLAGTYLRGGWVRRAATLTMLLATAASLALVSEGRVGAGWLIGPVLGTVLVPADGSPGRLSFEAVRRRSITLAATILAAVFAATKFPIGENPTLLSAVPWLLGAVGAAWLISPLDARERTQALVLLVGAGAALLVAAAPIGAVTAAVSGMMALVPAISTRWQLPRSARRAVGGILLIGAAATAAAALLLGTLPHPAIQDLALTLGGGALPAAAVLLLAGGLSAPQGRAWIVVPGLLALLAVAPSLRWAALAALIASAAQAGTREERLAWLGLLVLASTTLLSLLTTQAWGPRAQIVGLAGTLVLIAIATRSPAMPALVLGAAALAILEDTTGATPGLVSRFQWVAAAGAVLLLTRALLVRRHDPPGAHRLDEQVILGLLLLAAGAHDPIGLGALAVVLLVVDLAIVRRAEPGLARGAVARRWFLDLATSGWPASVRFAGVTLAVVASLQTSLAWGLLSAALLVALKLIPVIDPRRAIDDEGARPSVRAWLSPAVSLACGLAPALVLRMLRV